MEAGLLVGKADGRRGREEAWGGKEDAMLTPSPHLLQAGKQILKRNNVARVSII